MINFLIIIIINLCESSHYYGEIITFEDRIIKNNTFLYYYDPVKLNYTTTYTKCKNSKDCRLNWCLSESICSKEGYCLNLMDFPCLHTKKCNPIKKICESIQCYTRYQCNDNIFCNGMEICDNRICKQTKPNCVFGTCIESNQSCTFINKMLKLSSKPIDDLTDYITINLNGPPLWDSNSLSFQVSFLVIVIVFFILIIGIILILILHYCCCKSNKKRY